MKLLPGEHQRTHPMIYLTLVHVTAWCRQATSHLAETMLTQSYVAILQHPFVFSSISSCLIMWWISYGVDIWELLFSCDQAALQMVFSVCLSVRLSVCLSHLFHHVPIIVSSWNFQELLPWSRVMSMQKVKVRGQRSRSQRSTPNLAVSGL